MTVIHTTDHDNNMLLSMPTR